MKKHFILFILSASLFTFCSKDDDTMTPSDTGTKETPMDEEQNCVKDYTLSTTGITCNQEAFSNVNYNESSLNSKRELAFTNKPNHPYWVKQTPYEPVEHTRSITLTPKLAATKTSVLQTNNRPKFTFGVALNGVVIAPAPAEPFIFENKNTGEYNWDWVFEPTNNMGDGRGFVKLDCSSAHVSKSQGYHYHGNMYEYAETLYTGISSGTVVPNKAVQMGWAADGYPILYLYGPNANGDLKKYQPSYRLKEGDRPGDGITAPCGSYDGRYTEDYEYVEGLGDLDECNGISQSVTLTTALGTETFDYFYVVTEEFPQLPRCFSGTPDVSFD